MRIVVGRVGRAHGVRGEVAVQIRTDDPDVRFAPGSSLFTEQDGGRAITVRTSRWHNGRLMVCFDSVADRGAAEALTGTVLYRDDEDRIDEDEAWYDHELIGCAVRTEQGEAGTLVDVVHGPAQDLLAVELPNGQVRLVPLVAELVTAVDVVARVVTVADRPGLLSDEGA